MPSVSVIVPLYNKEKYILNTIRSILEQTVQDIEVLIVDDGSTDKSIEIVQSILDKRIKIITQANHGPGYARNVGVRNSNSPIIAFLDADDTWMPKYLEFGLDFFSKHKINIVCQGAITTSERAYHHYYLINSKTIRINNSTYIEVANQLWANVSNTCCTLFSAELFNKYGGFYDKDKSLYGEDAHLLLRLMLSEGIYFKFTKQVIINKDASELSNKIGSPHQIPPYLQNSREMIINCPPDTKEILQKLLFLRALSFSRRLQRYGYSDEANRLLREHEFHNDLHLRRMVHWFLTKCLAFRRSI